VKERCCICFSKTTISFFQNYCYNLEEKRYEFISIQGFISNF